MDNSISSMFRGHSVQTMQTMMQLIEKFCVGLSKEQIWRRDRPEANAIGNLLMHLEGNIRYFIGHCLEGKPDVRVRTREFDTTGGIEKAQLLADLRRRMEEACAFIESMSDEQMAALTMTMNGELSGLAVVYRVVGHLQQHTGQIVYAAKAMA